MNTVRRHPLVTIVLLGIVTIALAFVIILLVRGHATKEVSNPVSHETSSTPISNPSISFDNLSSGQSIVLPITVAGKVKGNWFFEGSFPVELQSADHTKAAVGLAHTPGDWMTTNMIPFSVTISDPAFHGAGYLVFKKDNPSGDPQFDDSVSVQVIVQ